MSRRLKHTTNPGEESHRKTALYIVFRELAVVAYRLGGVATGMFSLSTLALHAAVLKTSFFLSCLL